MDVNPTQHKYLKKIKFALVFFCCISTLICCKKEPKNIEVAVNYQYTKATSITFEGSNIDEYQVSLKANNTIPILGKFADEKPLIKFSPLVPFTAEESYVVLKKGKIVGEFTIEKSASEAPEVLAVYPQAKVIPENLLKMYFVFSKPMQQSEKTLDYIQVFNVTENKEEKIFLELENELWNKNHTVLTLWLDPGRIKKDLIPNKELGIPIKEGNSYQITISDALQGFEGIPLGKEYGKTFTVGGRDSKMPNTAHWELTLPTLETKESLGISFHEALDAMLIEETIEVFKGKEKIEGGFMISKKANNVLFVPKTFWEKGDYKVIVSGYLEDLAGNNLNRLFDTDLQSKTPKVAENLHFLSFKVE